MKKEIPSPELLRKLLRYDSETGQLFWRERSREMFGNQRAFNTWNSRYASKPALTNNCHGYLQGAIFERKYLAHRVAWAIHTGEWPKNQIDHINGVKSDNRIENLREATSQENMRNVKRQRNNKSGVTGISWEARREKWLVQIGLNGKLKHVGYFSDFENAVAARKDAEMKYGFHKNHGRTHAMMEKQHDI